MGEFKCNLLLKRGDLHQHISADPGMNLHTALLEHGILHDAPCCGKGTCGKCKVRLWGQVSQPTHIEREKLSEQELEEDFRLACQVILLGHGTVEIPEITKADIQIEGLSFTVNRHPLARRSVHETPDYGFAFDIGTTTLVAYLVNLETGEIKGTLSELNEQRAYGADVITRIAYVMDNPDGEQVLHKLLVHQISAMLETLLQSREVAKETICAMSFAGNTTMMHFLMGLNPQSIAVAPFSPVFTQVYCGMAGKLGFDYHAQCPVYLLPSISGYIGADVVAGILACALNDENKIQLLVDLGTNGEMALSKNGKLLCCSVAAGPAFEGAKIRCGVGGIEGAIDTIVFENGQLQVHTIGNQQPIGLCGSGLVDAVSMMLEYGIIDEGGRLTDLEEWDEQALCLSDRLQALNGEKVFVLSEKNDLSKDVIFLSQQDIRELQLAKAAVHAGLITLLDHQGVTFDQIDEVWLAGGFGNKININSAIRIGLFPKALASKMRPAGNTSGIGSIMTLLSKECRERCEQIKQEAQYLELSGLPGFNDTFVQSIGFE